MLFMVGNVLIMSCYFYTDGEHVLVVLLQQVHGVYGHAFLRAAQEKRTRVYSACDTPRHHAHVRVVRT